MFFVASAGKFLKRSERSTRSISGDPHHQTHPGSQLQAEQTLEEAREIHSINLWELNPPFFEAVGMRRWNPGDPLDQSLNVLHTDALLFAALGRFQERSTREISAIKLCQLNTVIHKSRQDVSTWFDGESITNSKAS